MIIIGISLQGAFVVVHKISTYVDDIMCGADSDNEAHPSQGDLPLKRFQSQKVSDQQPCTTGKD